MRIYVRYDLPDENNETRRERNERFGYKETPNFEIPDGGFYIWDLYTELSNAIHRVDFNGYYYKLLPSEIIAWSKLTGTDISSSEYEIITAMDTVFCNELNKDKKATEDRKYEQQKQEMEKSAKRRKFRR